LWRGVHPEGINPEGDTGGEVISVGSGIGIPDPHQNKKTAGQSLRLHFIEVDSAQPSLYGLDIKKQTMKFGNFEIFSIVENSFRIDGGAMFGVVPKIIWEKLTPPDEKNRVKLDLNLLLIKTKNENILIDAGIGGVLSERQKKIYGIERPSDLERKLSELDLTPEHIDLVILTHLHADHAGGVVSRDESGRKAARFPNARHLVQIKEWNDAMSPDERTAATYFTENLRLLEQSNLLELVDGEDEVADGIRVVNTGGHTPGHQAVLIDDRENRILWPGDIIPSTYHLRMPYVASVDLFPRETMALKKKFLDMCTDDSWLLAFDHDVNIKLGKLERTGDEIKITNVIL
jgi:glyoxylase-like metal-dependent hydrolase (beta-lactamase superfamily II)